MTAEEVIQRMLAALNQSSINYMLVGSLASNIYGVSRSTQDVDFVVESTVADIKRLTADLGPTFNCNPQLEFETVTGTNKLKLQEGESGFEVELFFLSEELYDRMRFSRRVEVSVNGTRAFALSPEDVVITKLQWLSRANRSKDASDAKNVLVVQANELDWPYVEHWCREHGSLELLKELRTELQV